MKAQSARAKATICPAVALGTVAKDFPGKVFITLVVASNILEGLAGGGWSPSQNSREFFSNPSIQSLGAPRVAFLGHSLLTGFAEALFVDFFPLPSRLGLVFDQCWRSEVSEHSLEVEAPEGGVHFRSHVEHSSGLEARFLVVLSVLSRRSRVSLMISRCTLTLIWRARFLVQLPFKERSRQLAL